MDVINLVSSSDEEDNDGGLKGKIRSNKGITIKKVKTPKTAINVKNIPIHKVRPTDEQQNNNTKISLITPTKKQIQLPLKQPLKQSLIISTVKPNVKVNAIPKSLPTAHGITITQIGKDVKQNNQNNVNKANLVSVIPSADKTKVPSKPGVRIIAVNGRPTSAVNMNKSVQSIVKPAPSVVNLSQPSVKSVQPIVKSSPPMVKIFQSMAKSSPPLVKPIQSTVKPTTPVVKMVQSTLKPTPPPVVRTITVGSPVQPTAKPTHPVAGSVQPTAKPTSPVVRTITVGSPVQSAKPIQPVTPVGPAILKPAKRVIPTKISDTVTMRASSMEKSSDSDMLSRDSSTVANDEAVAAQKRPNGTNKSDNHSEPPAKRPKIDHVNNSFHEYYMQLLDSCKKADPTKDMDKIIIKLEKYYQRAHPTYVNSKSFQRLVQKVANEINAQPKHVYVKIQPLLEELKTRRHSDVGDVAPETVEEIEGNKKKAKQIQKLSNALRILQERIRICEEAEVDWDDEVNSKYCETERVKKRACEIYEKLCDLTGESRSAERIVKKPIKFSGTAYTEFNRKLERFINETKAFPDMFDVLRIMDHCSRQYKYSLSKENRKTIAQDAFHQVGTLLQKRRKADLYEMVQYFAGDLSDPAAEDIHLKGKLDENRRHYTKRMKEVMDKFTMSNTDTHEEESESSPEKRDKRRTTSNRSTTPTPADPLITQPSKSPQPNDKSVVLNDSCTDGDDLNDISKEDVILIDEQDVEALEEEFYPTIASVTSLHPSKFNDLLNFESIQLESSNIL